VAIASQTRTFLSAPNSNSFEALAVGS